MIQPILALLRGELFHERQAFGERDIGRDLPAQGAMTNGFEPCLERLEHLLLIEIGKLFAETFQVAEGMLIDKTDQPEQLQQGVLQGRGGEQ